MAKMMMMMIIIKIIIIETNFVNRKYIISSKFR
jgi:hypothetical protein